MSQQKFRSPIVLGAAIVLALGSTAGWAQSVQDLDSQISQAQATIRSLQSEISQLHADNAALRTNIAQLESELNSLKTRAAALDAKDQHLDRDLSQLNGVQAAGGVKAAAFGLKSLAPNPAAATGEKDATKHKKPPVKHRAGGGQR